MNKHPFLKKSIIDMENRLLLGSLAMLLGMPSTYQSTLELTPTTYKEKCSDLSYLVERQQELCGLSYNILQVVGLGAKMGINECQYQFRNNRWNCSTFMNTSTVFGGVLHSKSRETAYIYSISSAGVAYSITRGCSRGEITECGCDDKIRAKKPRGSWKWGGCSEDIRFGEKFSKDFVDSREDRDISSGLMNLHNNEAGRRVNSLVMNLLRKFDGASRVRMVVRKKKKRLKPKTRNLKKPSKRDLVYIDLSPNYCSRDENFDFSRLGVLGTEGRKCNETSYGVDGCSLLCCGRGYHVTVADVNEKCNCKFVWCCEVKCEMCHFTKEEAFCNYPESIRGHRGLLYEHR
ncbi:Protein Wnt-4 [Nymphon striatum]|nr:Protein Wnt-4 [Nymphon striatum]